MSIYNPYGGPCSLGTYYDASCVPSKPGKVRGIAFVLANINKVGMDTVQWWLDTEFSGLGTIIPDVLGSHDGSSVTEDPGGGDVDTRGGAHTYTGSFRHKYLAENWDFYQKLKNSTSYELVVATDDSLLRSGVPVSIRPTDPIEEGMDTRRDWVINMSWISKTNMIPVANTADVARRLFKSWRSKQANYACLTPVKREAIDCPTLA